jgi:hypothetical protein
MVFLSIMDQLTPVSGLHVPAGSTTCSQVWGLLHDEGVPAGLSEIRRRPV